MTVNTLQIIKSSLQILNAGQRLPFGVTLCLEVRYLSIKK